MKKTAVAVLTAGLMFPAVSTLSAGELTAEQKEELTAECRAVGEQHGIAGERMEEWINRCLENIKRVQRERDQQMHEGHGDGHGGDHGGREGHQGGMEGHGHGMEHGH